MSATLTNYQNIDRDIVTINCVTDYQTETLTFTDSEGNQFSLAPCPDDYQVRIDRSVDFSQYQLDPENPNKIIFDNPLTVSPVGFFETEVASVFKGNTRLLVLQTAFQQNLARYKTDPQVTEDFWILPAIRLEFLTEEECNSPEYLFTLSRIDNAVAKTTVRDQVYQVNNYFNLQKNLNPKLKTEELKTKTANYFRISVATVDQYRRILSLLLDQSEINELVETGQLSVTYVSDFYKAYDSFTAKYPTESVTISEFIALCQREALTISAEDSTVAKVPQITGSVVKRTLESIKPISQEERLESQQESTEKEQTQKKKSVETLEKERIKTMDLGKLATEFYQLATDLQNDLMPLLDCDFTPVSQDASANDFVQDFVAERLSSLKSDLVSIYGQKQAKTIVIQAAKLRSEFLSAKTALYKQIELFESLFDVASPNCLPTAEQVKQDLKAKREAAKKENPTEVEVSA